MPLLLPLLALILRLLPSSAIASTADNSPTDGGSAAAADAWADGWELKRISGLGAIPRDTLSKWANEYVAACLLAAADPEAFNTFKTDQRYQRILEHDGTEDEARAYVTLLAAMEPSFLEHDTHGGDLLKRFEGNDCVGGPRYRYPLFPPRASSGPAPASTSSSNAAPASNPTPASTSTGRYRMKKSLETELEKYERATQSRNRMGRGAAVSDAVEPPTVQLSVSTLRYMWQASTIGLLFDLPRRRTTSDTSGSPLSSAAAAAPPTPAAVRSWRIIEIGGGYGGLSKIMSEAFHIESYVMYDIDAARTLAAAYVGKAGVRANVTFGRPGSTDALGGDDSPSFFDNTFDLAISNFALSELSDETQRWYAKDVLSRADRVYLTLNSDCPGLAAELKRDLGHGRAMTESDWTQISFAGRIRAKTGTSPSVHWKREGASEGAGVGRGGEGRAGTKERGKRRQGATAEVDVDVEAVQAMR